MTKSLNSCLHVFLFAAFCILISSPGTKAQTINAASCSSTDVQAALNKVAADGTTVNIPAGNCGWSTTVSYTGQYSVTISGAGNQTTIGGGDATIITDNLAGSAPGAFSLTVAKGKKLRLTAISFFGGSRKVTDHGTLLLFCNDTPGELRADHIHIANIYTGMTGGDCFGVVDHSLFEEQIGSTQNGVHIWNPYYNRGASSGNGDGSWASNTDLGTANFLYFENNIFTGGSANDCTFGGRNVFRFNTFNTTAVQTHPTGGGGPNERGCRAWEIYNNTFNGSNSNSQFNLYFLSSGTGVIWGNSAPIGYQHFISLHSMRRSNVTYGESPVPNGWGYCGTSFNGTGSSWDQNLSVSTGYACIDQPGRGKGDLIIGMMPNAVNSATGTISWPKQALEPVYEWNDIWAQVPGYPNGSLANNYDPDVLIQNQDFYLSNPNFTGAAGVGSGLLAVRPANCTTGVAYWATDQGNWNQSTLGSQGVLYKCTSTNTWTAFYTPFPYPHPLVSGSGSTGNVVPPTNLAAVVQ